MCRVQEEMDDCMTDAKRLHHRSDDEEEMDLEGAEHLLEEVTISDGGNMKAPVMRFTRQIECSVSSRERLTWMAIVLVLVCLNFFDFRPTSSTGEATTMIDHLTSKNDQQCVEQVTVDQLFNRFGIHATWDESSEKAKKILRTMQFFHKDGEPVPINGYPYLFVGSAGAAYNKEALLSYGITHIVDATFDIPDLYPDIFQYHNIRVHDKCGNSTDNDISLYWEDSSKFIEDARANGGKVLVHCRQGKSRSVSVVTAYLVKKLGMGVDEAIDLIKETRPKARPNHDYKARLYDLEKKHK